MDKDEDSMFGSGDHIIRACALIFLVFLAILFFMSFPEVAAIILAMVVLGFLCFMIAYIIGLIFGWWEYI